MAEKELLLKPDYCCNKEMFLLEKFKALHNQLNIFIKESKENYHTLIYIKNMFK